MRENRDIFARVQDHQRRYLRRSLMWASIVSLIAGIALAIYFVNTVDRDTMVLIPLAMILPSIFLVTWWVFSPDNLFSDADDIRSMPRARGGIDSAHRSERIIAAFDSRRRPAASSQLDTVFPGSTMGSGGARSSRDEYSVGAAGASDDFAGRLRRAE